LTTAVQQAPVAAVLHGFREFLFPVHQAVIRPQYEPLGLAQVRRSGAAQDGISIGKSQRRNDALLDILGEISDRVPGRAVGEDRQIILAVRASHLTSPLVENEHASRR